MKPISLVHKYDSKACGVPCSPCCDSGEDVPRVYLTGVKALATIPEEGTITFKFRRKEVSVSDDGERPVRLSLELREIIDVAEKGEETKEVSSAEALDKLLKDLDEGED